MMHVKFSCQGKTWTREMPRIDAGTLAEACERVGVSSFECESDFSRGELLGIDGKAVGSFRVVVREAA